MDLQGVTGTPQHLSLLKAIVSFYCDDDRIRGVGVFGSLSRGDWDEFSDLDLNIIVADTVSLNVVEEIGRLCQSLSVIDESAVSIMPAGTEAGDVVFESLLRMSIKYHPISRTNPKILSTIRFLTGSIDRADLIDAARGNEQPQRGIMSVVDRALCNALEAEACVQRGHTWESIEALHRLRANITEVFCLARGGERALPFFRSEASDQLQSRLGSALPQSDVASLWTSLNQCLSILEDDGRELGAGEEILTPQHMTVLHGIRRRQPKDVPDGNRDSKNYTQGR